MFRFFLCFIIMLLSDGALAASSRYALFIDAGSSGSRLHLFQYETGGALPVINDVFTDNVKPGLSAYADHPEQAGESLKKLLDDALIQLAAKQVNPRDVSISVLATAGMRLLPEDTQQRIYDQVTQYLQSHYSFSIDKIETLPGSLEGLFGWLDANYLANRFASNQDTTAGIIDMGGASTEIAFATNDHSRPDDEITLSIAGRSYTVFSKSFLGMGQDVARSAINQAEFANSCYPLDYPVSSTTHGVFDLTTCGTLYNNFINQSEIIGQLIPLPTHPFVAYSGAYYTLHFLAADQPPNKAAVEERIRTICNKSWAQLKHDYPNEAEKYLSAYCANSVYLSDLLFNTYQLHDNQLIVENKINQKEIDWTLGALLFELAVEVT